MFAVPARVARAVPIGAPNAVEMEASALSSSPPRTTYAATVMEETQMLKLMSQPSTTFMTSAMEYILMPLISTVISPKQTAASTRDGSPKRSFR